MKRVIIIVFVLFSISCKERSKLDRVNDILDSKKFQLIISSDSPDTNNDMDSIVTEIADNKAYSIMFGEKSEMDEATPFHVQLIKKLIRYNTDSLKYSNPSNMSYFGLFPVDSIKSIVIKSKISITNMHDTILIDTNNTLLYLRLLEINMDMLF